MTDDAPPSVLAAWEALQTGWDQRVKHEAFLAAVSQAEAFSWAAKKYNERPDDPIAKDQLARLQKAAVIVLMASATRQPEPKSPYRMVVVFMIVLVLFAIVGLLVVDSMPKQRSQPAQPAQMR